MNPTLIASDAVGQVIGVLIVGLVIGLVLASLIKEGVRYARLTPEQRRQENDERAAAVALVDARRNAASEAHERKVVERESQGLSFEKPTPGLVIWGWFLTIGGGLTLSLVLIAAAMPDRGVYAGDIFNFRLVFGMIGCCACMTGAGCFCTQRVIDELSKRGAIKRDA